MHIFDCIYYVFLSALLQCIEGENTWRDLMKTALENLIVVLKDENTISPYEMCSSGLVQALFTVLNNVSHMVLQMAECYVATLTFVSFYCTVCDHVFCFTECRY